MPAYKTIDREATALYKEKNSKFIAYAFPVTNRVEIEEHLKRLKKEHPKASHICYAWRLGLDKIEFRANDAGEPSGTAGPPIIQQIDSFQLTDILLPVIRYYGGTNLGSAGLLAAYKLAAKLCLDASYIVVRKVQSAANIEVDFKNLSDIMTTIKRNQVEVFSAEYGSTASLRIRYDKDVEVDISSAVKKAGGTIVYEK